MRSVLRQARQEFDWIVLDLPPLGPVVDARAMVGQIDALVLVLEWGRTTRRLVRATLEAEGHHVEVALEGPDGLDKVRPGIEALIVDLGLPKVSGMDLIRAAAERVPGVPILVVSGRDHPLDRDDAMAAGATAYLVKPFSPEDVVAALTPLLGR